MKSITIILILVAVVLFSWNIIPLIYALIKFLIVVAFVGVFILGILAKKYLYKK